MSRFTTIDLSQLPAMIVLEQVDSEAILSRRMTRFVELWNIHDPPVAATYDVSNLEFDPIKINQECNTDSEMKLRDRVNQAARAITLAYAISGDLDAVASRYPGGMPRLANESDDHYRKRVWLSVNPLSPHGTAEAYQFWALTALGGALRDVSTIKIRPDLTENPTIVVTCLAAGADPRPTQAQLLEVRRYIVDEHRMAMTDVVSVGPPKVRDIDYYVRLWFFPGPDAKLLMAQIRKSVADLIVKQYWLGYDHTVMALHAACALSGVARAVVVKPEADILIPPDWIGRVNNVTLELVGTTE
jgi:phage-related baseplate assembly protein